MMKRPMLIMLVCTGLFFGGVFGWKAFVGMQIQKAMAARALPPITVSTVEVGADEWAPTITAVGSLRALQGVDVTAQLAGQITELHFDSGDRVEQGDLLVQQFSEDDLAELESRVADRELAELNYKRLSDLSKEKLVSEFDFDAARAELARTKAAEKNQRVNIAKKSIRAPFTGTLGLRNVDLGQYIEPGDTIVRLDATDQLLVDFTISQRDIASIAEGQPLVAYVDAWPDRRFTGRIDAVAPRIDAATRTVQVRGVLDNPEGLLAPGMFARIEVELPVAQSVVTVPQSAIAYSPYGDSVFVMSESAEQGEGDRSIYTVTNTFVKTGATRGDQVAIVTGLEPGMTVVTAGQQKLRNGARVVIDNSVPVSNSPEPQPANN